MLIEVIKDPEPWELARHGLPQDGAPLNPDSMAFILPILERNLEVGRNPDQSPPRAHAIAPSRQQRSD